MKKLLVIMMLPMLLAACSKEPAAVPLPIDDLKTLDVVPVRSVDLPLTSGAVLLCKRAIDDPTFSSALILDRTGASLSTMDFTQLPRTVENITFSADALFITDLVPLSPDRFILLGYGIQQELDDRLHLVVYQVDGRGTPIFPPVRRFVSDRTVLNRSDDIQELYSTQVLGALSAADRLVAVVRYDREEEPVVKGYHRTYQLLLGENGGNYIGPNVPLADEAHLLRAVVPDGEGGTFVMLDTTGIAINSHHGLLQRTNWGAGGPTGRSEGILSLASVVPSCLRMVNGTLHISGHFQSEPDVRTPFLSRTNSAAEIDANTSFPPLSGSDRSAIVQAIIPVDNGVMLIGNVFEQRVVSDRAIRDDRFADLVRVVVPEAGSPQVAQPVVQGMGLHALGAWMEDDLFITGSLHPFLNTDYLHGFVTRIDRP